MNDQQKNIRGRLKEFAQQLKEQSFPESTVSVELAHFVSDAFTSYLEGEEKSLDAAFGLTLKRGAPGYPREREAIAKQIAAMQSNGKSWKEITETLTEQQALITDKRELIRVIKEDEVAAFAHVLTERLNSKD